MKKYISIFSIVTFLLCMCVSIYYVIGNDYARATYNLLLGVLNYMIAINNRN